MKKSPRIGLFITCLVDLFRPNVGFATLKLLQDAGCLVEIPNRQVCCGQPAYNSGDETTAKNIAEQVITMFEGYDYVVAPSGSCLGMIKEHYPRLFEPKSESCKRAQALAQRCYELTTFLIEVCKLDVEIDITSRFDHVSTYHDSCSGLRELNVKDQPRKLLQGISGLVLEEMEDSEVCCGFGGTFCVKYPKISERMVSDKTQSISNSGAEVVLGGDLGCLLNIAGRLKREGRSIKTYHIAEVLADMTNVPAIGEGIEP